jgi:purine-binding chemotaxis protein CheW
MKEPQKDIEGWRQDILNLLSGDTVEESAAVVERDEGDEGDEEKSGRKEYLAFMLGEENFGVDIRSVSEILLPRPVTKLPRAPEFILGIVSLRGTILPVADTARRLGLQGQTSADYSRIVVIRDGEEYMGFAVGSVTGVVRFSTEEVKTTQYAASVDSKFLTGIGYDSRQRLMTLLSAEALCDFTLENG